MRDLDLFYSDEALKLAVWGYDILDEDRPKSIRILRAANKLEDRYRKHHQEVVNNPFHKAQSSVLHYELTQVRPPCHKVY